MEWIIKNKFYVLLGVGAIVLYFSGYMSKPDGLTKRQWEREKQELLDSAAVIYEKNMRVITEENVYLKDSIGSIIEIQELYRINKEQELYDEQKKLSKALDRFRSG